MNKMNLPFSLTILSAAMLAIYGPVMAAEGVGDDSEGFTKPQSTVSVGVGHLSGKRDQLGRFDGMTDDGGYLLLDGSFRKRDDKDGTWVTMDVRNLGLDSRELSLGYEKQGNWGISLEYNQIPSDDPKTYITGVTGIGTTQLQYGSTVAAAGAANINIQNSLYPATNEVHLGTERDITKLNLKKVFSPGLDVQVSFRHEEKKGEQLWGRGVNPEFAVQPIDWTTEQLDAIVNYKSGALSLTGGYSGSWFDNANSFVDTIGGSQTLAAGANYTGAQTVLSLPLDNQAHQLYLNGAYKFSPMTRGTFKVAYTHATQNDSLDAYTNALLATGSTGTSTAAVPVQHDLDAVVDTTVGHLGLTSQVTQDLSVQAKLRYNNRNNKTNEQTIGTGGTTSYVPRDFKDTEANLEATYQLPNGYSVTAGLDYQKTSRDLEFAAGVYEGTVKLRRDNDDTTLRLEGRKSLSETLDGSLALLHTKRSGSAWMDAETECSGSLTVPGFIGQCVLNNGNPIGGTVYYDVSATTVNWLNPFYWASRDRNKIRMTMDWNPTNRFGLQLDLEHSKDDYTAAKVGLQDGSDDLITLDGSFKVNKDWQLNGWYSYDVSKAHHIGMTYDPRTTSALINPATGVAFATLPASVGWICSSANTAGCQTDLIWDAHLKDTGQTIGLGVKGNATPKLKIGANLQWTRSTTDMPIVSNVPSYNSGAGLVPPANGNRSAAGVPDITSTEVRLALNGTYALQKNADLRLDVIYTHYKTDDWTWMTWDSTGTTLIPLTYMDGTKVISGGRQNSTFVGVRYEFKF